MSSQVFLPFWFYLDGIRNPTRVFQFRIPLSYPSLYQTISPPTSSYSFTQGTAMTISALLYLDKYSLFAKTLNPTRKCSMVSSLLWHTLQHQSWTNPLAAFYHLVSTICSNIVMIEDVFLPCKFLAQTEVTFVELTLVELGRTNFAVPLTCSFWFSWTPLLSANKSSLSATLVSILFLHQSPHR